MKSIMVSTSKTDWISGSDLYGEQSIYKGKELVQLKILSDRREEEGGLAYLVKFNPPVGKLFKIVAVARSDEHTYVLEGGYCNRAGQQLRFPGDYALNPTGRPHSAFVGKETVSLVVYAGAPDEIREFMVIDLKPAR